MEQKITRLKVVTINNRLYTKLIYNNIKLAKTDNRI
mgnify:CR=1 FL=1